LGLPCPRLFHQGLADQPAALGEDRAGERIPYLPSFAPRADEVPIPHQAEVLGSILEREAQPLGDLGDRFPAILEHVDDHQPLRIGHHPQ
jgi:hypothetical protein